MKIKTFWHLALPGIAVFALFLPFYVKAELIELKGIDIALKTLSFVESMPEKEEGLSFLKTCKGSDCTFSPFILKQGRAWPVLAYIGLYEATKDPVYLEKTKSSMEKLLKECVPARYEEDCRFIGVQTEAAYQTVKDKRYLDYIKVAETNAIYNTADAGNAMISAIMLRQAVLAYKHNLKNLFQNIKSAPLALDYRIGYLYNKLKDRQTLLSLNNTEFKQTSCWVYLAEIELYKALDQKDDKGIIDRDITVAQMKSRLLSRPKEFFDKFSFSLASLNQKIYSVALTELEPCAEAALNLYEITGKSYYKFQARSILQGILERHWDSEYAKKYTGDNAFALQGCRKDKEGMNCYKNNKALNDSSYAVYLFSRLKDENFAVAADLPVKYFEDPQSDPGLREAALPPVIERPPFSTTYIDLIAVFVLIIILILIIVIILRKKKY